MRKIKTDIPTKVCSRCQQEFPATEEFWRRSKTGKYGFQSRCKSCAQEIIKDHYLNYTERDVDTRGTVGVKCPLYAPRCVQCNVLGECWRLSNIKPGSAGIPLQLKKK